MTSALLRRGIGKLGLRSHARLATGSDSAIGTNAGLRHASVSASERLALMRSHWIATLEFSLPRAAGWALHPRSVDHIRTMLDGRFPLISRNEDVMFVSYLAESGESEELARARAASEAIADSIGLDPSLITDVVISNSDDAASPRPSLRIVT